MVLATHSYRCRINNPRVQAIWDVARDAPVGFARDDSGVSFTVSLPSGHIMMLAVSETPTVELFPPAQFPGRPPGDVLARCRELAGGRRPPKVSVLTPDLRPWLEGLAAPPEEGQPDERQTVLISYGHPRNRRAAERLATFVQEELGVSVATTEQAAQTPPAHTDPLGSEWQKPVILIGDEWTNNDLAMHGAYWGIAYGAHLPFTATYAWPGKGRAVVSLSRPYVLTTPDGRVPFMATPGLELRRAADAWPVLRRKLHIAGNGRDAERAVREIIRLVKRAR